MSERRMSLSNLVSGVIDIPERILLYGPDGVGKSNFGACSPKPVFIGAEEGTANLEVDRFPQPETFEEVLEAVEHLTEDAHDFETLVIDTLDWLEPLIWEHCLRRANLPVEDGIEAFGYGKGFTYALDQHRALIHSLDRLRRSRSMRVIALAHSQLRTFANPVGENWDRYQLKIHDTQGKSAAALWREWVDVVLFANHEEFAKTDDASKGKAKGRSTGRRFIWTTRSATWDAKSRYDIPERLPFEKDVSWSVFAAALAASREGRLSKLEELEGLLETVGDPELVKKVRASMSRAKTPAAYAKILEKLEATLAKSEEGGDNE